MQIIILDSVEAVADYGAVQLIDLLMEKPNAVLGLATGSTPIALYRKLIRHFQAGKVSFARARTFNLDEYLGLSAEHPQSYRHFMQTELFDQLDIDPVNTHLPDGAAADPIAASKFYENAIEAAGGIDLQLLGIGRNGHIGFNEPSSSLASRTRVKTLTPDTIQANKRFFKAHEFQPALAITMGIGTILETRRVVLIATGKQKSAAVKAMVEGPVSARCPASSLQWHPNATVVLDSDAASKLEHIYYYQRSEDGAQTPRVDRC